MKKRICGGALALALLAALLFAVPLPIAWAEGGRVFDQAGLFEAAAIAAMEERAASLRDSLQMDLVIVTTDDAAGKDSQNYADDYYDNGGFGVGGDKSGVLYLIDMDNRQVYISTCGQAIDLLSDERVGALLSDSLPYLQAQDYSGAPLHFLDEMEKLAPGSGEAAGPATDFTAGSRVSDRAGLLSGAQVAALEKQCAEVRDAVSLDLVVVTAKYTEGKSTQDYADDFYDQGGYGMGGDKSGALFLIDMGHRQAYISTCGRAIDLLTDSPIDSL